ncbi:MAG: hypothetical protein WAZ18_01825 [Alphaproteobacteria bacterium]
MRIPYLFTFLYIASIPLTNLVFTRVPPWILPDGTAFSWAGLLIGLLFILRDFCQREVGTHGALAAIALASFITYHLTTPELALAGLGAFAIAELADWAIFSFTQKPLAERILYSSLLAGPLDTALFLWGANSIFPGIFTWSGLVLYSLTKIMVAVGAYFVLTALARRKMLA